MLLVAGGVVLLVNGKDDKPTTQSTPEPGGRTMYTPSPTPTPNDSKGPNDVGVEVGWGVWFTPSKGWLPDWDKSRSGKNYILQQFNARGLIDGYYWVRQTELYDAKGFAEHLVDVESNGMEGVRIGKGTACKPANPNIKACYAVSYTGAWVAKNGKKVAMSGLRHGLPGPVRPHDRHRRGPGDPGLRAPRERADLHEQQRGQELLTAWP